MEENLGSEEAADGNGAFEDGGEEDDEEYDTEEEEEDDSWGEHENGIRYEEEEASRASSRFDDAGRSVVFDPED